MIATPLICPRCKSQLVANEKGVRCTDCDATFPKTHGVIDFAPGEHYDSFSPGDVISEEHQRGLELEIEGSRRRIEDFYWPLIPKRARRILDCGCGNGVSVEALTALGYDAWGNDLSELRAWQWRDRAVADRLVIANALALPFPDGYFDVVISSGVIEHIGVEESAVPHYSVRARPDRDAQRAAFIRELARVLAPSGDLFIDCPNGAFPIDFWHGDAAGRPRFHSVHEQFLPRFAEIREIAKSAIPSAEVDALSPYKRLQFRQASRHLMGRLLAPAVELFFRAMRFAPVIARSALNPFLVVRIRIRSGRKKGDS